MVSKLMGPVLVGVLIASAAFNLWASFRFYFSLRELYKLQAWVQYINSTRGAAQSLAFDSVEYGKQHPAMDPILQRFDLKARPAAAPAQASPSPKPAR
jgi:hypothetical protein